MVDLVVLKQKEQKPYARASYPELQIDVKYVPSKCVSTGQKYYQFTEIDECTRWTYRQMYDDKSSYTLVATCPQHHRQVRVCLTTVGSVLSFLPSVNHH